MTGFFSHGRAAVPASFPPCRMHALERSML
jgi:hypothetical protein